MAILILAVKVDVDPRLEDPHEVAQYVMDADADDPVPSFVDAEWFDGDPESWTGVRSLLVR